MKRHKQVGISKTILGQIESTPKRQDKNPLFKQSNRLLYNFDTLL